MKVLKKTLVVENEVFKDMQNLCISPSDCVGKDQVVFDQGVEFEDGYKMVIQVVASLSPTTEPCWTQGVLYDDNWCEVDCTQVGESFEGEYHLDYGDKEYIVEVIGKGLC